MTADERFWLLARVHTVPAVCAYLERRRIDPEGVARGDLARVLLHPSDTGQATKHFPRMLRLPCLVVPLFNPYGVVRSVLGRSVTSGAPLKSCSASGGRAGLAMLDGIAHDLLTLRGAHELGVDRRSDVRVCVSEGEIDWMTWASRATQDDRTAYIGVVSGSWSRELADRIPSGCVVVDRTHDDPGGRRMGARVADTLRHRCTVLRPVGLETGGVAA